MDTYHGSAAAATGPSVPAAMFIMRTAVSRVVEDGLYVA
jgi:hypothetical protein